MRVIQRICSILLLLVTFGASALYAQTYDKLWKQVEQAQKKSLPQTVIKLADEIYRKGRQEQNAPQMLKAYICRETYQEGLTPDSLYSSLKYMESWAQSERNPHQVSIFICQQRMQPHIHRIAGITAFIHSQNEFRL